MRRTHHLVIVQSRVSRGVTSRLDRSVLVRVTNQRISHERLLNDEFETALTRNVKYVEHLVLHRQRPHLL